MKEFKGTQGEWRAIAFGLSKWGKTRVVSGGENEVLGFGKSVCSTYGNEFSDIKESEANAQLISAAPDLLEALLELLITFEENEQAIPVSDQIRIEKAINKALK